MKFETFKITEVVDVSDLFLMFKILILSKINNSVICDIWENWNIW